jgi:uroporphyrinogen decarboxylase
MMEFAAAFVEEPEKMKANAAKMVDDAVRRAERYAKHAGLLDGFALCSDYCFNAAPFFRPSQFAEFVTPYLERLIREYRSMGFYTIKHTDGNIMPIIDQLVDCKPHALHSLDPQGGVDLAAVKRDYGDKVALIGNVNCGLLQTGTPEEVIADVRRTLRDGMPGGGYVFATSNCVYSGLPLERYRLMHRVWREEGVY